MMRRRRILKKFFIITALATVLIYFYSKMKSPEITIPEVCHTDQRQFLKDINISMGCECSEFRFHSSSYVDRLVNGFNSLAEPRHKTILYLTTRTLDGGERKVVLKYRKDTTKLLKVQASLPQEKNEILRSLLSGNEFNGQPHFCNSLTGGNAFNLMSSLIEAREDNLLVANMNFEIILLKFLKPASLPVPVYIANCGLYLMESFGGSTMDNFYKSPISKRLKIAKNLLLGALSLTEGFQGFRIYLTDATKDNIAVDEETLAVSFIDLDDVIIQHADSFPDNKKDVHRHEKIECDNCFAYSTKDICGSPKSDINLFTICQLLLEDLKGNHKKGFLYLKDEQSNSYSNEWRSNWKDLLQLLRNCVYCDKGQCPDRFQLVDVLVRDLDTLILNP